MRIRSQFRLLLVLVALSLSLSTALLLTAPPSHSAPPVSADRPASQATWEYLTISIDAPALGAQLYELSRGGWEVFSITVSDSAIEPGPDATQHARATRYQVTGRRIRS
jgi:hypothetical protein